MRVTQHIAVEADTPESAQLKLLGLPKCQWYTSYELTDDDPKLLTEEMVKQYQIQRYNHFINVSAGLDMNRLTTGISAYGDDTVHKLGNLHSDIKARFEPQIDKAIEVITFVAERWHPYSVLYDLENNHGSFEPVLDRISERPDKQFIVDVRFSFKQL